MRQSGKKQGRCCLSKRGDPEARRLLYLAACQQPGPYQRLYGRSIGSGLPKIAALNVVARKLARTAWALYTTGEEYRAQRVLAPTPMAQTTADETSVISKALRSNSPRPTRKVAAKRAAGSTARVIKQKKVKQERLT